MQLTRRTLFRTIAAGAAATVAPSILTRTAFAVSRSAGKLRGPIRLDRNENANGPSARVVDAIQQAASRAHRYPDAEAEALRWKISSLHRVAPEQVILGHGSTDIMRMAVQAFASPSKNLVVGRPTFDAISVLAEQTGAKVVAVPLADSHSHDLGAMLSRSDAGTGLVYVCNPNNSTGSLTPRDNLVAFIRALPPTTYVLIDEAYHDYVGKSGDYASFIDRPADDPRVIVTRTFSKIHGLAGLRIGYAITAPETAARLAQHRLPEEVNSIGAAAAIAALDDTDRVFSSFVQNADDRQEFFNEANARMARTIDSQTNFVMLNAGDSATAVIEHFAKHNILLPPVVPSFQHIRVSLGTTSEMHEFWRVWDLFRGHTMSHG